MPSNVDVVIRSGDYPDDVAAQVAELLKTDAETLKTRLSAGPLKVKSNTTQDKAIQISGRLQGIGVECDIVPVPASEELSTESDDNPVKSPLRKPNRLQLMSAGALAVVATLIGGYYYWTTTPEYSLSQISQAIESRDLATFETHVHIEDLLTNTIRAVTDSALAEAAAEDEEGDDGWGAMGRQLGAGIVAAMQPVIVNTLSGQIRSWVETGARPEQQAADAQGLSMESLSGSLDIKSLQLDTASITKSGKVATITIDTVRDDLNKTYPVEIRMRDIGRYWQVFAWSNAGEYMTAINADEEKALDKANQEQIQKLSQIIGEVDWAWHRANQSRWTHGDVVVIANLRNLTDRGIVGINGSISLTGTTADSDELAGNAFQWGGSNVVLQPGHFAEIEASYDIDYSNPALRRFLLQENNELNMEYLITGVLFDDAEMVRTFSSYEDMQSQQGK